MCGRRKIKQYRRRNPAKYLITGARARAKRKGIEFSITEADIMVPVLCPVLGIVIMRDMPRCDDHLPSLDRIDPALGYVPGNVRVISYRANMIKSNATADELRAVLAYVEQETLESLSNL